MADTIDTLELEIKSNAGKAEGGIDRLVNMLMGLDKSTKRATSGMQLFAKNIANINRKISNMESPELPITKEVEKLAKVNLDKTVSTAVSSLARLASAGKKTEIAAQSFPKIGDSLANVIGKAGSAKNIDSSINRFVSSLARLTTAGDKATISAMQLPTLGKNLETVITKIGKVGNISDSVNLFVQSIGRLANAGTKTGDTATGLGKLADETINFFNAMAKAPQINENTLRMTEALSRLASAGGKVGTSTKSATSSFSALSKGASTAAEIIKKAFKGIESLLAGTFKKIGQIGVSTASTIKKVASNMAAAFSKIGSSSKGLKTASFNLGNLLKTAFGFKAIQGLLSFGKQALEVGSDITEVENVVDTAFGSMAKHAYDFASTATEQFGLSELAAKQYSGTMMAMLKSSGVAQTAAAKMSTTLAGLAGDIASFYNIETDEAFYKLRAAISGETEPMKALGVNMNVVNLEAFAMSQGITKSYKSMTLAEQATLRYNYILAKTGDAQGDFARTAGTWANQVRLLKLNFQSLSGVIGQGLIAGILPAIKALNALMAKLMSAAKSFRNFMYVLMGKKIETTTSGIVNDLAGIGGAADNLEDLGDAGAEAGKKLKNNLFTLPFDELNILSDSSDSVKDSLADIGAGDFGGVFDDLLDKDMETPVNKWAQMIRDAFLAEDWEGLGKAIAEMLNAGLRKVYDAIVDITPKVEQALKNFARVFNSFTEYFDWELLGRTIGAGINLLVKAFNALTGDEGIDFELLGSKLSTGFRGLVDEINWQELGNALGNGFMVAWRLLDGFITDMSRQGNAGLTGWQELGNAVAQGVYGVFERINFGQIGTLLANGFNGIFEIIQSFADRMANDGTWSMIATNISNGLNNAIAGIRPIEAAQALGKFVTDLLGTMLQVAETTSWDELGTKIGQFLVNIPWSTIIGQVFGIISDVLGGLFGGLAMEILSHFGEIGTAMANGFNTAFEKLRAFTMSVPWDSIAVNIYTGLNNMIHGINWAEAGATLSQFVIKLLGVFQEVAQNTDWEAFGRGIGEFLSNIEWGTFIGQVFDILWTVFSGFISGLFDTKAGKVFLAFIGGLTALTGVFNLVDIGIKAFKWISLASDTLGGLKGLILTKVVPAVSGAVGTLGGTFSKIVAAAKGAFTGAGILTKIGTVIFSPTGLLILGVIGGAALIIANWDKIKEVAKNLWENVLVPFGNFLKDVFTKAWENYLSPALKYIAETILPPLMEVFSNLWNDILVPLGKFIADVFGPILKVLGKIFGWLLTDVVAPVGKGIVDKIGGALELVADVIGDVGDILSGLINFITGVFTGDWEKAWDGVAGVFKGAFNLISDIAEGVLNNVIAFVNNIISGINQAGSIVGIPSIPLIPELDLPKFFNGGVIQNHMLAEIGEYNRREAILPLENRRSMNMIADSIVNSGASFGNGASDDLLMEQNALLRELIEAAKAGKSVSVQINGRELVNAYDSEKKRMGHDFSGSSFSFA